MAQGIIQRKSHCLPFTLTLHSDAAGCVIQKSNCMFDPVSSIGFIYFVMNCGTKTSVPTANKGLAIVPSQFKPTDYQDLGWAMIAGSGSSDWQPARQEACYITDLGIICLNNFIWGAKTAQTIAINGRYHA